MTGDDGVSEDKLKQIEGQLGLSLPAALREAYLLFGRRPELFEHQDPMLPPSDLFVHEDLGGVLCFRSENQGCAFWGVRLCDLGEADPPVVVQSRDGWRPFMDRLSLACVELVISETLFSDGRLYNACELPADIAREVPRLFQRVALPDYPMWTGNDESPVRWFSAPGLLLRQDGLTADSWLHVRGKTLAHLSAACIALPGRWAQWQGTAPTAVDELPFQPSCGLGPLRPPPL
ncbi:SMI1/KNR4 family protein [Streptomyces sp. NBC_01799]|uniref:SMI1/KNR4 family protein n=1 Tax=Streptomyces sp. NBC_01800 TaxID=2975945 RepID=UPI002DDB1472|nr:SMI1/KNR4 family protein [Streptomyces sp. NBC_01800]WSA65908.1 SMI1/KNR4 family protein [Streptomyces sp. NBC_01800]WSA74503.1 SMI1/KNR4 family protein [Streptomyces sp. NBC_01799]